MQYAMGLKLRQYYPFKFFWKKMGR